jgi:hypothetical protein
VVQSRASRGSVTVEEFRGKLRLHLPRSLYGGKNKYLSLGLDDTSGNRRIAEAKAKQIESDIIYERFDPSLAKYRPEHFKLAETQNETRNAPKLDELWERFIEYKRPQCSPSTMVNQYRYLSNYMKRLPFKSLDESTKARDWILANVPLESAKRFLVRINACCKWALDSELITSNPYEGMAKGIKKPKSESAEGFNDINPFTAEERDRILEAPD